MSGSVNSGKLIWQLWLFILLFSVCWQDFFLVNRVGEIARTPVILLLPAFVATEIYSFRQIRTPQFVSINNLFFYFIFGAFCVSAVYLAYWYVAGMPTVVLGEYISIKAAKLLIYYVLLWLFFRHAYFVLLRIRSPLAIGTVFYWVCLLHLVLIVIEVLTIPYALPFFHALDVPYYRVRLLTAESSFTGGVIVLLATTAITCNTYVLNDSKRKQRLFFVILLVLLYVVATTSKMFIVTAVACTSILLLTSFRLNLKYLVLGAAFLALTFLIVYPRLEAAFLQDLQLFTSTVTRTSAYLNGLLIAFHHPFGTGGLYFYYFLEYVRDAVGFVTNLLGGGNTEEILNWGIKDDRNISTGAEFSSWLAILGFPGGILFILIYFKLIRYSRSHLYIYWGMLYFAITGFLSEIIISKPNVFLFWALILYFQKIKGIYTTKDELHK